MGLLSERNGPSSFNCLTYLTYLTPLVPGPMITFRRSEIALPHAARVHHDFFHSDGRIYHPELQRMVAGSRDRVRGEHVATVVFHGIFPIAIAVLRFEIRRHDGDDLRCFVFEGDGVTQRAVRNKIERGAHR